MYLVLHFVHIRATVMLADVFVKPCPHRRL